MTTQLKFSVLTLFFSSFSHFRFLIRRRKSLDINSCLISGIAGVNPENEKIGGSVVGNTNHVCVCLSCFSVEYKTSVCPLCALTSMRYVFNFYSFYFFCLFSHSRGCSAVARCLFRAISVWFSSDCRCFK